MLHNITDSNHISNPVATTDHTISLSHIRSSLYLHTVVLISVDVCAEMENGKRGEVEDTRPCLPSQNPLIFVTGVWRGTTKS